MTPVWWRLVRFGFRLLYQELAFTYDTVSQVVSLGAWRCWQRAALKRLDAPAGALILELAHGTGDLQLDLHAAGYRAIGLDLSPNMGRIAQKKAERHGLAVRLVQGRAQQLPFPNAVFAAVVSTFPSDFIVARETLNEVQRVLRPGGQFIIVPNAILTGGGVPRAFLEWLYRITGQRAGGSMGIAAFFEAYGFEAGMVQAACPRSVVQVIVARKRV